VPELDPEDAKLVTLARGARTRAHAPVTGAPEGAAVRDDDGRTYSAATVEHSRPHAHHVGAARAVSAAVSSGARSFEAAVVVTEGLPSETDLEVLRPFGVGVPVLLAGADGDVRERLST
jgi:cytidine deaminase